MEKVDEKIIDLVDIIAGPDPALPREIIEPVGPVQKTGSLEEIGSNDLETLVRKEVERLIRSKVDETIEKMIREILVQEIEKAIAREIEDLKRK